MLVGVSFLVILAIVNSLGLLQSAGMGIAEKVCAFGVRIPVSYFMSRLPNVRLFYIGLATPCSTVVQVILCLAYYAHLSRREKAGPAV